MGLLFRREALEKSRARLEGDIVLIDGGILRHAGFLLPLAVLPFVVATLFWSYPRIQQVPGWLTTSEGLVQVRTNRPGTVESLPFREGDLVKAGDVVAMVRVEQKQPELGETPERTLLSLIDAQLKQVQTQIDLAKTGNSGDAARARELVHGSERELAELGMQLKRQDTIAQNAWADVEAIEALKSKGFASVRDVRNRQDRWAEQVRNRSNIEQQRTALQTRIVAAKADLARLGVDLDVELNRLESARADLEQRAAEIESRRSYALVAPVSGRLANLVARRGYFVDGQRPILTIVPLGAKIEAELFIPTSASAFIRQGQEVRLLFDAFPYQRFGSGRGTISQVSAGALAPGDVVAPLAFGEPVYVVRVALSDNSVTAFGERVALKPGMMLKANVLLEERSIFAWMFEPLYAVRGRT